MGFETQKKGEFILPKVNIQDFNIVFDNNHFKLDFDWKLCPPYVIDIILSIFKGTLLNKVKSEARAVVNTKVVDTAFSNI